MSVSCPNQLTLRWCSGIKVIDESPRLSATAQLCRYMAKRLLIVISCVFAILLARIATPVMAHQTDSTADALLQVERKYVQAEIDKDVETLSQIFADDLRYTGFDGVIYTKEQILSGIGEPLLSVGPIELSDMNVRQFRESIAIVTGRADLRMSDDETDYSGAYRFTRVYEQREGEWQMVAGHTSRIPED